MSQIKSNQSFCKWLRPHKQQGHIRIFREKRRLVFQLSFGIPSEELLCSRPKACLYYKDWNLHASQSLQPLAKHGHFCSASALEADPLDS